MLDKLNEKTETFNTDLRKWGSSKAVLIPKLIMERLNIIEGDELEVTIKKIKEVDNKKYRCLLCNYIIEGSQIPEDGEIYCFNCQNEDKRGFEEILND